MFAPAHVRRIATRANLIFLSANGLSLLALSLILFRLQAPVTFFRYDGVFILSVAKGGSPDSIRT
jgi:hypothetical protein